MGITEGHILEVSVVGQQTGVQVMNVWQFEVTGTFSGISAGAVAHAFWDEVKAAYRGMASNGYVLAFEMVKVLDLSEAFGEYGEYAIPVGERAGTRDTGVSEGLPPFNGVGVKLSVGTRATRPGQKRFAYLTEIDQAGSVVSTAVVTAVDTLMNKLVGGLTLPSPALGMDLLAVVVSKDPATGVVTASQEVVGWVINPVVTSQVSRKH